MAKRRISRSSKMRLTFFGTLSIIAIFYFLFSLLFNVYTIYDLTNDKQNLQNSLLKSLTILNILLIMQENIIIIQKKMNM